MTGDFATCKRKYDDSTSPSSPPSARRQTGSVSDDSEGSSSGPAGQKPYVSTSSIPSAPGYGGISKKIEIPNGKECLFISDKGEEVINYLQRESGAKIQVIEDRDADSCSITRTVELTGNADDIDEAEMMIMDLLAEGLSG